jgi:hypothetical protein
MEKFSESQSQSYGHVSALQLQYHSWRSLLKHLQSTISEHRDPKSIVHMWNYHHTTMEWQPMTQSINQSINQQRRSASQRA